jgi:hypothetical protein
MKKPLWEQASALAHWEANFGATPQSEDPKELKM